MINELLLVLVGDDLPIIQDSIVCSVRFQITWILEINICDDKKERKWKERDIGNKDLV